MRLARQSTACVVCLLERACGLRLRVAAYKHLPEDHWLAEHCHRPSTGGGVLGLKNKLTRLASVHNQVILRGSETVKASLATNSEKKCFQSSVLVSVVAHVVMTLRNDPS